MFWYVSAFFVITSCCLVMVKRKIQYDPEIFLYSITASPVVPHLVVCRCYPVTKEVALVLSFSQILSISKPALECVDNSDVCKFSAVFIVQSR